MLVLTVHLARAEFEQRALPSYSTVSLYSIAQMPQKSPKNRRPAVRVRMILPVPRSHSLAVWSAALERASHPVSDARAILSAAPLCI